MEGLLGQPLSEHTPAARDRNEERLVYRWVAFLFLTLLGFVAMIYLVAAAFSF